MSSTSAPEGSTKLWFSWLTTTHRDFPQKNDTIHGTGVLTYMNFLIFMVNVGKYIYISVPWMVYGLWFQIYYPPWNEQRGKNPENWPFQKETHGIPTIYFQGQFVSFREGKTAEWGHVSTVCLSNRRTRTILEIESVPPNKKYRVGLNLSKVLYQVSKWNETSKHIKASTLTNSVVVSFPPKNTQFLNMEIQQKSRKFMRWLSWFCCSCRYVNPTTSQYSIITIIFTHTLWLVSLDLFNFPSWLCSC